MRKIALVAILAAGVATPAMADGHGWGGGYGKSKGYAPSVGYGYVPRGQAIHVSCYRGPKRKIWWDKPNHSFIESLMAAGYDRATAKSIGYRICRDPALVGNPAGLRAAVAAIVAGGATPRGGGHKHSGY